MLHKRRLLNLTVLRLAKRGFHQFGRSLLMASGQAIQLLIFSTFSRDEISLDIAADKVQSNKHIWKYLIFWLR